MNSFAFVFNLLIACTFVVSKAVVHGVNLKGVPSCGSTCLEKSASNAKLLGKCSLSNVACLCKNEPFQLSVRQCVVSKCQDKDKLKMVTYEDKQCPGQGLSGLPACGQICLLKGAANKKLLGRCAGSDTRCLCSSDPFQESVRQCVIRTCPFQDSLAMLAWSNKACPN